MTEPNLATIIDAIIVMSNEAIALGVEFTGDKVEAAILARWPEAAPILELAFERAGRRLIRQSERDLAEADALQRHWAARRRAKHR